VGIAGTVDSFGAPSYGWEVVTLFADLAQAGTVEVYQRLRGSSSWALTNQYVYAAAGILSDVVQVTGEQVRVLFTNGGVAQKPEMIFGLA
jgi:hypothetical protein